MAAPAVNPDLVNDILKAAAAQSPYDYGCLCDMYDAGNVTIDKNQDGYIVSITQADGGILDIALGDNL